MYSHELQTCDWPRNVGCEVQDARSSPSTSYRDISQGRALQQPQPQSQPHIRFSSTTSKPTIAQQYHRQPSQSIQVQNPVQTLPPPPELSRIAPNPVITSRGQPKPIIDSQEDIAKVIFSMILFELSFKKCGVEGQVAEQTTVTKQLNYEKSILMRSRLLELPHQAQSFQV